MSVADSSLHGDADDDTDSGLPDHARRALQLSWLLTALGCCLWWWLLARCVTNPPWGWV